MRRIADIELAKAGKIIRTHGYKGALILSPAEDFDLLKQGEPIFIILDGISVPFFLSYDIKKHKNDFQITLDNYETETQASKFIGKEVFIEIKHILTDSEFDYNDTEGYEVFDFENNIGTVKEFLPILSNPILVVKTSENSEVLIPLDAPFLKQIDDKNRKLFFELPTGLLNLDEAEIAE